MTTIERVACLIDKDSPRLEIMPFIGSLNKNKESLGSGLLSIISLINNSPTLILCSTGIKGGTFDPFSVKKVIRSLEIAFKENLEIIYLIDSGGAFLHEQINLFADNNHYGKIFYIQSQIKQKGIKQKALVYGNATAGGAYLASMCDEIYMIRNKSSIFLAGPPLVKAATTEDSCSEEIGGAQLHLEKSKLANKIFNKEEDALIFLRNGVPIKNNTHSKIDRKIDKELSSFVENLKLPLTSDFDSNHFFSILSDSGIVIEYNEKRAKALNCSEALVYGMQVGFITNRSPLRVDECKKMINFLEIMERKNRPVVFFHNTTGFAVGKNEEADGITPWGAKLIYKISTLKIDKISIIIGGSYGAGNYAMCGKGFAPNFIYSWPSAQMAIMGPSVAKNVLENVTGKNHLELEKKMKEEETPFTYSMLGIDDGIILPQETKKVIGFTLNLFLRKRLLQEQASQS